jgi:tetratricopeptide (TPR) repeat protein
MKMYAKTNRIQTAISSISAHRQGILGLLLGIGSGVIVAFALPTWADPPLKLVTGQATVEKLKADAAIYVKNGFDALAINAYRAAIDLEDKARLLPAQRDPEIALNLGLIYAQQGNWGAARNAFQRSVETNPTDFQALYQLAQAELQVGNRAVARQHFERLKGAASGDPAMQAHIESFLVLLRPAGSSAPSQTLTASPTSPKVEPTGSSQIQKLREEFP